MTISRNSETSLTVKKMCGALLSPNALYIEANRKVQDNETVSLSCSLGLLSVIYVPKKDASFRFCMSELVRTK